MTDVKAIADGMTDAGRDMEARIPSIGTELGQIGADIIAYVRTADVARIAELEKALRKITKCHSPHSMVVIAETALGDQP